MKSRSSMFLIALASAVALVAFAADASAQWSVEGRVGSAIPTGELTEPGLDQTGGVSFAAEGMYTFRPNLSVYGGASRQRFNCDGCAADVSSTGLNGGLKYVFLPSASAFPWVRGGLMVHQPAVAGDARDWGVGLDSAVGVDWEVTESTAVVPAVRLNTYSSGPLSVRYVTIDLGVHMHPGQ